MVEIVIRFSVADNVQRKSHDLLNQVTSEHQQREGPNSGLSAAAGFGGSGRVGGDRRATRQSSGSGGVGDVVSVSVSMGSNSSGECNNKDGAHVGVKDFVYFWNS
jgi:hypothetical protein